MRVFLENPAGFPGGKRGRVLVFYTLRRAALFVKDAL
jgi:hypothetical protein